MKRWILGTLFSCGLAAGAAACGDDATTRHDRDDEAGAAGNDTAGHGPSSSAEGGMASVREAGSGGVAPAGDGGEPAMSLAGAAGGGDEGGGGNEGGAACGSFDDLLAPRELCSNLRTCYPDLQEVDTQCVAPGDGDATNSYSFFEFANYPNLPAIRACLCALPDQEPARAWVDCILPADRDAADCFDACPELGNGCAGPFQTASMTCNDQHQDGYVAVATCLAAQ
jgi:hypothetical protein